MAHKKIYLAPRKQSYVDQFKPDALKGLPLRGSVGTGDEFATAIMKAIAAMRKTTEREIRSLFTSDIYDSSDLMQRIIVEEGGSVATDVQDASIASAARILLNKLNSQFIVLFKNAATAQVKRMVDRSLANSAADLNTSFKTMLGNVSLNTDIYTDQLRDIITASTAESVGLITRIPQDYLGDVQGDVMRSITSGRGVADLMPAIEKRGVQITNYAKNTSLDQTRKVYNKVNAARMQAVGCKKFQWIHSGGGIHARPHHIEKFPVGLNGGIFSFDDLPIIDEKTGERGIPGDAINCKCVMRPIFDFDDDEKDNADD